jgi:hypothetical protein
MNNKERKLRAFEAVAIAVAGKRAKLMPTTPEIEAETERLYAAGRRMMAQSRYNENARYPVKFASPEIRPEILAMSRAEVIAQLGEMRAMYPLLQYAHRDCESLSDHDLRSMLEDATRLTKGKE